MVGVVVGVVVAVGVVVDVVDVVDVVGVDVDVVDEVVGVDVEVVLDGGVLVSGVVEPVVDVSRSGREHAAAASPSADARHAARSSARRPSGRASSGDGTSPPCHEHAGLRVQSTAE